MHALVLALARQPCAPGEPAGRDLEDALRRLRERRAAEARPERVLRDLRAQRGDLLVRVALGERLRLGERLVVVVDARPERGERAREVGGQRVGAAHLDGPLEPHLGEERVEVHLPVAERRAVALEAVLPEAAKGLPGVLDDLAVALDEEHRHVERPRDVVGVARAGLPHLRHEPGAVVVDVEPHLGAVAAAAPRRALVERRVREERRRDRPEPHTDAQLADRVLLAGEVVVGLHGGRAAHHVEAVLSALGEVDLHDPVASLRDPVEVGLLRERVEADAEPHEPEVVGDVADLGEVSARLRADAVHVRQRRARELELATRLERDRREPAPQRDQRTARLLGLGGPAVAIDEHVEDRLHAAPARVRVVQRRARLLVDAELLGLRADAKRLLRLLRAAEDREEIVLTAERLRVVRRTHGGAM